MTDHDHARSADSSGRSWHQRHLTSTGFDDDDGAGDEQVRATAAALGAEPTSEREVALLREVSRARWLVPIVAVAVDTEIRDGMRVDGHSEMSSVVLQTPDGQRALPIFSGLDTLSRWDPQARPVPVTADRAAQAAVAEGCDTLLLDLGEPHAVALRPSMVWALAMRRDWAPAHIDPHVIDGVAAIIASEPAVAGHLLADGHPGASGILQVTLLLPPGLDQQQVGDLATRIGERIAADGELRARIDGISFVVEAARGAN